MASSLEELLAEEGFRGRKSFTRSRASFGPEAAFQDQRKSSSTSGSKIRTERTRSDGSRNSLPRSDGSRDRRPRDYLVRRAKIEGASSDNRERYEGSGSNYMQEGKNSVVNSFEELPGNEIVEVGVEEDGSYKDIYSNDAYASTRGKDNYFDGVEENVIYKERSRKDIKLAKRHSSSSNKHMPGRTSFNDNNRKSMKQPETSYSRMNRDSWNSRNFDGNRNKKRDDIVHTDAKPALDEVAIQAMVSILSGYMKPFLKDKDFRATLRHNCFSSLIFVELEDGQNTESTAIANLEQAIQTVEKVAEESASAKDLKKASLQLRVITGLNLNDLKDGFTSGVPNSKLSACAHIYLSVIYKLQKKDRISAKHVLQVFCDLPSQARTVLLPDLWDHLFFPHLSHLKVWYNQEAESLPDTPSKCRKLTLLNKVYNEILDSGTYQFAVYYKDWLTEGIESPSIPSINIPSISVRGVQHGGSPGQSSELGSPAGPYSPQPMVSKKLYDAVFGRSSKPGVDEAEDDWEAENFDNSMRSSDGSTFEVKQTLTYSSEIVKFTDQDTGDVSAMNAQDNAILPGGRDLLTTEEEWRMHGVSVPLESDLHQETRETPHILHAPSDTKANELVLKRLAKSVFEVQQNEISFDLTVSALSQSIEEPIPESFANSIKTNPSFEESYGSYEYFDEGSFFSSIPQDFICPLTGQLFEDPVTLETGQTFERVAIGEWFGQGQRTCPVTGKNLECSMVPLTNFVLKRVIDSWKTERYRHLLAFMSQIVESSGSSEGFEQRDETIIFILEQLLTAFSKEETLTSAKHLISLGGLQFLIRRFEYGKLEERTRISALLSCCIEADAGSRNQIAEKINKQCLLELIHSKQVKSRTNAVLLLTELICLNRRKDATSFLSGLQNEQIVNTMHILLVYLQNSPLELRPLVAVLLLHLDLLVEPQKYSIYRDEAVDAIIFALEGSLIEDNVQESCCKALLVLGGRFSFSGKLLTDSWILKQAGFNGGREVNSLGNAEDGLQVDGTFLLDDDEEQASEEWLVRVSSYLLSDGKRSFLETISKCISSGNLPLVKVCLTTVAWLSYAISSLPDAELQLSTFSALISQLKEILENGKQIEHKILASLSLLNFIKLPECRVLLKTISEEILVPLRSLAEVTWTARQLHTIISGEDL